MEHKIIRVVEDSIADELGISPGDVLTAINGKEIEDVFDYETEAEEENVTLLIRKQNNEEWELEIEKDPDEDLGLVFESSLMSDYRSCANKCVFCFIDQMPPGMRETLYFKDDDSRLSFLQGNYITGTNMSGKDIERIIRYHMEPINISVHTTDPELRCRMLHNRFAGKILDYLQTLYEGHIHMNGQIVLCKGLNDGDQLRKTLTDLMAYLPYMESVSVVPVGLTKYREGLYPLQPLTREDAEETIDIIEEIQKKAYSMSGLHFAHASDELYLLAQRPFPEEDRYDGYLQYENGVGMGRLLYSETENVLKSGESDQTCDTYVTFATGLLAEQLLKNVLKKVIEYHPERSGKSEIVGIRNVFFGENVTVAGLVTGRDLIEQLKGRIKGEYLVLPNVMFRSGEEVFLDDVTKQQAEEELHTRIIILKSDGLSLVKAMCGCITEDITDNTHGAYELPKDSF